MIIDIHAHVFAFPKATSFLSAEQQISVMDAKGVDKAVILPVSLAVAGAELQSWGEILYICEKYPGRFIPFCNIDPRIGKRPEMINKGDFIPRFEKYREMGCKGLGEVVTRMPFDDPVMLALFGAADEVGFPVTFHTTTPDADSYGIVDDVGLPRFERVLRQFPNLRFFGHSQAFWSEIGGQLTLAEKNGYPKGPVKPGGRLTELFRRYPNLHGDISAGSGFNALSRDPEHAFRFIDEFQDRLLLGLDYCSITNNHTHIEWLKAQRDAGNISHAACEKILGGNAARILNLS